ncbi:protein Exd1 homolog [Lucilia sericata]|uniref:protein Exd1 homolog n=1 Tax=Lucilia sericata TaxID=13632 RepID=UPI0018A8482E|nr:protein Exd1 homolog [Lucilia sericata]XP_037813703.1 protein Exd1 homolog [Lucilia sericata]XP_037813704.1 protein Exd1 homolog [Lucilia sericata]XP_037813705.1 protein Exd1 homolog [Lucilia sericata]
MTTPVQKLMALKVGQLLLVETIGGELLVGTLKSINIKYLMVELDNVRDIKTNYTYQSSQILAYTQMKNIKLMLSENEANCKSTTETDTDSTAELVKSCNTSLIDMDQMSNSSSSGKKPTVDSLNIQLTALDLHLLQTQLDSMLFITQTDHKYHKALNDMKSQTVIGLLIDPIEMGRNCKTSLMAVSTAQNIYIFDMLAIGKIFKEIRLILEAERPRKAVHFSHKIADHLKYRHNIVLKGIFDTFLAYCVVTGEKCNLTLEEAVQKTFSISNVYFENDEDKEISVNSYQRPLPPSQRMLIAKKVAFQLKLYDHLLHEYMLKNFYRQCENFSQTFYNNDDNFQVGQQLHPSSRAGYEHIQPNGNWKDKLNFNLEIFK